MSVFAGVVAFDGAPIDQQTAEMVSRAIVASGKGRAVARRLEGALFVERSPLAPGGHGELQIKVGRDGRTLFAAAARLDNREELGAALGLAPPQLATTQDAALI